MSASARLLGIWLGVGAVAALALGVALGLAQEESVLTWIAYMLSIAGAITIGFACFSGAPTSARKHLARRMRTSGTDPQVAESKPFVSELVGLFAAGLLLIAAGTGIELLT
ncbi:MAG: hypothetical protein ABI717_07610 [Actinomycetota bacterium]